MSHAKPSEPDGPTKPGNPADPAGPVDPDGPHDSGDRAFTPSHRGGSGPPLLLVHGYTGTWRDWDPIRPELERRHDVLAVTQAGHAGGPPINGPVDQATLPDAIEAAMDEAGFSTAHIVGNSLGGFVALQLASRGRAESVVALAPAGGWRPDHEAFAGTAELFRSIREMILEAAPYADVIASTPEGRRRSTLTLTENYEHLPPDLIAHLIRGAAACELDPGLFEVAQKEGWNLDVGQIECPVRIAWGSEDKVLPLPDAAVRFREEWLPEAEWIEMEGVGHCPQLDVPRETAQLVVDLTTG